MKFEENHPPRKFTVGAREQVTIKDCGRVSLEPDEQITFLTESGAEYDVTRKDWGFYATPSLNGRLSNFGLKGVLIKNRGTSRYFVLLVEEGKNAQFEDYCAVENLMVVAWLDSDGSLSQIEAITLS